MSNERNLISDQVITNRAPVRNQDNKHAKKASDGTMSFMVWSITGTALAACSGPIFGDGTSIGGGGGRSGGNGATRITEDGAAVPIGDTQFASVPETGGVYVRPELVNDAGTVVPAGEVRLRPEGGNEDGSNDVDLSAADDAQRGVPITDVPTGFAGTSQTVAGATFYFVSRANLELLVVNPRDYEGDESDLDVTYYAYDPANEMFATEIAAATLSDASTVAIAFAAVDDPATDITLDGAQDVASIMEATNIARTKIADLDIVDPDGGESGTLELAGTHAGMFEIDGTVLYLSETALLDYEPLPDGDKNLNVRVQLEGTPNVGVNVMVAVTNVEPGPGMEVDDPATAIRFVGGAQVLDSIAEAANIPRTEIARLEFDDDDGGSNTLELVGAQAGMFELSADNTVLYFSATPLLDFEIIPEDQRTLNVRVQLEGTPAVGVDVTVTVTDVEGGPGMEGIPIEESGPAVPIADDPEFDSVPSTGGVYIKAEVQNDDNTVEAAKIIFRQGDLATGGSGDVALSAASVTERGVPTTDPTGFAGADELIDGETFYYVSEDMLERLFLMPNNAPEVSGAFQIKFHVYNPTNTDFNTDITTDTASTVAVAYDANFDDPATVIALDGSVQDVPENADTGSPIKVADLTFTDADDGSPGTLELVGTQFGMFELGDDDTAVYLSSGASLNRATLSTLNVRVQRVNDPLTTADETTIGVDITVTVTEAVNTAPILGIVAGEQSIGNIVVDDGSQTATTIISFDDADVGDLNDGLTIRGVASDSSTAVPDTPVYADAGADLTFDSTNLARIVGEYGTFTISRNDGNGMLSVTYELNATPHDDVSGLMTGEELFEKLTVYVADDEGAPSDAQDFVVRIEGPAANSVPTSAIMTGSEGTAIVANDNGDEISASTMITFDDAESANSALTIRGYASSGSDTRPTYDSNSGDLTSGETMVTGTYGDFTITRDDTAGTLRVEYNLNEDHDDVRVAGFDLVERLTVYVNDGEDTSTAQDFVVTIDRPVLTQNGFYHSPAAGAPPAYELPDNPPEGSRIVYSVGNVPTAPNFEARVLEITTGTGVLVTVDENTGEWTAFPTGHITSFPSNGGGDNGQASRNFYIHAHNVAAPPETLGGLPVPAGENAQVDALFTRMYIIADNTISDVVDEQLTGYAGRGRNELFIGTGGNDDIGTTRGGTDVIFARVGDDTFTLGRHDSDTIYHRFSSSDSDWVNTDGGDTISGYVRSGANVANDTFIFIDTDSDTVATEDDFAGQSNIKFFANIGLDGATLEIEGFEIRFVNPTTGAEESTITINYHMDHRPDITTNAQKDAFGIENTVTAAGPQEIDDGGKYGHYFGETPDAFQVIDDGDLPPAIASIVADVI